MFEAALQGLVTAGVVSALPTLAPAAFVGKFSRLSLLHLCFASAVVGSINLPHIWGALGQFRGKIEGLATINQALMGA